MSDIAFQDHYADDVSHCYGCGRLNDRGLRIRSFWDGDETVCTFLPRSEHTAIPGFVYGGLIAALIDCHGTGTAAAAVHRQRGRALGADPLPRFVTAALQVDYLRPTPLGPPLEVRAHLEEVKETKVVLTATVSAAGQICARGRVVAVRMPERFGS
jgi:uncharacterized protein (TIGR00369 family)